MLSTNQFAGFLNQLYNQIFACWYTFRRIKSRLKDILVGVDKNGCALLGDDTQKSAVSND